MNQQCIEPTIDLAKDILNFQVAGTSKHVNYEGTTLRLKHCVSFTRQLVIGMKQCFEIRTLLFSLGY